MSQARVDEIKEVYNLLTKSFSDGLIEELFPNYKISDEQKDPLILQLIGHRTSEKEGILESFKKLVLGEQFYTDACYIDKFGTLEIDGIDIRDLEDIEEALRVYQIGKERRDFFGRTDEIRKVQYILTSMVFLLLQKLGQIGETRKDQRIKWIGSILSFCEAVRGHSTLAESNYDNSIFCRLRTALQTAEHGFGAILGKIHFETTRTLFQDSLKRVTRKAPFYLRDISNQLAPLVLNDNFKESVTGKASASFESWVLKLYKARICEYRDDECARFKKESIDVKIAKDGRVTLKEFHISLLTKDNFPLLKEIARIYHLTDSLMPQMLEALRNKSPDGGAKAANLALELHAIVNEPEIYRKKYLDYFKALRLREGVERHENLDKIDNLVIDLLFLRNRYYLFTKFGEQLARSADSFALLTPLLSDKQLDAFINAMEELPGRMQVALQDIANAAKEINAQSNAYLPRCAKNFANVIEKMELGQVRKAFEGHEGTTGIKSLVTSLRASVDPVVFARLLKKELSETEASNNLMSVVLGLPKDPELETHLSDMTKSILAAAGILTARQANANAVSAEQQAVKATAASKKAVSKTLRAQTTSPKAVASSSSSSMRAAPKSNLQRRNGKAKVSEVERLRSKAATLEYTVKLQTTQLTGLTDELRKALQQKDAHVADKALQETLSHLSNKIVKLTDELASERRTIDSLKAQLDAVTSDVDVTTLAEQVENLKRAEQASAKHMQALEHELTSAKTSLEQLSMLILRDNRYQEICALIAPWHKNERDGYKARMGKKIQGKWTDTHVGTWSTTDYANFKMEVETLVRGYPRAHELTGIIADLSPTLRDALSASMQPEALGAMTDESYAAYHANVQRLVDLWQNVDNFVDSGKRDIFDKYIVHSQHQSRWHKFFTHRSSGIKQAERAARAWDSAEIKENIANTLIAQLDGVDFTAADSAQVLTRIFYQVTGNILEQKANALDMGDSGTRTHSLSTYRDTFVALMQTMKATLENPPQGYSSDMLSNVVNIYSGNLENFLQLTKGGDVKETMNHTLFGKNPARPEVETPGPLHLQLAPQALKAN